MQYLLGIDVGTSSVKVGVFGANGQSKELSIQEYPLCTPFPNHVELPVNTYC